MKRIITQKNVFALTLVLFLMTTNVFAQETETQENKTEREATRTEAREERRATLKVEFQNRMVNLAQNVTKRLSFGVDRLANITFRIETRISKLKAMGIDTGEVERKLLEAKDSLQATRNIIANIGSVQVAVGSDAPQSSFAAIRTQFDEARTSLKKTHTLLSETVALLKKLPTSNTQNSATSSESTEPTL
ncbi:MAG: hypothetical protein WAW13_03490 [Minisyncoccia bacterium]